MFNLSFSRKIEPNIRILVGPVIFLFILGLLIFYIGKTGYSRIKLKINEYNSVVSKENALKEKLTSLKEIQATVFDRADITLIALPEKNPANIVISRAKKDSEDQSVIIEKFSLKSDSGSNDVMKMQMSLNLISPDIISYVRFLKSISSSAPIISLNDSTSSLNSSAEVSYTSGLAITLYWSKFPETLPSITEPIREFSEEQKNIIKSISELRKPSFITLEPQEPADRDTPFN